MKKAILGILAFAIIILGACSNISSNSDAALEPSSDDGSHPEPLPGLSAPPYSLSFSNTEQLLNWIASENKENIWDDFIAAIEHQGNVVAVNGLSGTIDLHTITVRPDMQIIMHHFVHVTNGDRFMVNVHYTNKSLSQFVSDFSAMHEEVAIQSTIAPITQYDSSIETELYYYNAYITPTEGSSQTHSSTMGFFELDNIIATIDISRLSSEVALNVTWDNDYLRLFDFISHPFDELQWSDPLEFFTPVPAPS